MSKANDDKGIALILREHHRQLERICRRKYAGKAVTPEQLLETARELMVARIARMSRSIAYLAHEVHEATGSIEALSVALKDLKARSRKKRVSRRG